MKNFSERFQIKPNRWVYVPTPECVQIGREIQCLIQENWIPPDFFFHLRQGGHVAAIRKHLINPYFAKLDLSHFFGSIGLTRVTRLLKKFSAYPLAREWAQWSVVRSNKDSSLHLPFGFVQSPILASLAMSESSLGYALRHLSNSRNNLLSITVYVDDIILSSTDKGYLTDTLYLLKEAAARSRFIVNEDKSEGPTDTLHVFNIKLSQGYMCVTHDRLREFEERLCTNTNLNVSRGIRDYVASINVMQAAELC